LMGPTQWGLLISIPKRRLTFPRGETCQGGKGHTVLSRVVPASLPC
jgi:hypothetical protein